MSTQDERMFAMLMHLLGGLFSFFAPLIIWLLKRNESSFVDDQGKEALNFQISVLIYSFALVLLSLALIGFLLIPIFVVAYYVFVILASVKSYQGEYYRYPLIIRFIK
ncbi:DUF4870 domain-containing protein [Tepidibacillus marianensis]|uniref:DUF4870 domain-containing protein n=1 Tax=Tepidibacillus marianensis TaxID=3131995 RepID=UPI0030CDE940